MPKPTVGVIIPTFNHKQYIDSAIESVFNQDVLPDYLIIVDDGSSDGTYEYVSDKYDDCSLFSMSGVHHEKSLGPAAARNTGIKALWDKVDVFFFLDSDDIYEENKISQSIKKWGEAPDMIGCVYSDYLTLNSNGLKLQQFKEVYSRERMLQECLPNCDSLITKKALEQVGLFDESLRVCEDLDLWLRISEKLMLVHIPEPLLTIRIGEHSSSSSVSKDLWQKCYSRVFDKMKQRIGGQAN